jgi:hypothetical protein
MAFTANRRETKMLLRYDGHSRAPGVNTRDHSMKWRRIRRRFSRWMREAATEAA